MEMLHQRNPYHQSEPEMFRFFHALVGTLALDEDLKTNIQLLKENSPNCLKKRTQTKAALKKALKESFSEFKALRLPGDCKVSLIYSRKIQIS